MSVSVRCTAGGLARVDEPVPESASRAGGRGQTADCRAPTAAPMIASSSLGAIASNALPCRGLIFTMSCSAPGEQRGVHEPRVGARTGRTGRARRGGCSSPWRRRCARCHSRTNAAHRASPAAALREHFFGLQVEEPQAHARGGRRCPRGAPGPRSRRATSFGSSETTHVAALPDAGARAGSGRSPSPLPSVQHARQRVELDRGVAATPAATASASFSDEHVSRADRAGRSSSRCRAAATLSSAAGWASLRRRRRG